MICQPCQDGDHEGCDNLFKEVTGPVYVPETATTHEATLRLPRSEPLEPGCDCQHKPRDIFEVIREEAAADPADPWPAL